MCVCVGFTLVCSHVQQKVVMGRWVQGQTRGTAEVARRRARGQRPEKWVIETERACLEAQTTDSYLFCLSQLYKDTEPWFPPWFWKGEMIIWSADICKQTLLWLWSIPYDAGTVVLTARGFILTLYIQYNTLTIRNSSSFFVIFVCSEFSVSVVFSQAIILGVLLLNTKEMRYLSKVIQYFCVSIGSNDV